MSMEIVVPKIIGFSNRIMPQLPVPKKLEWLASKNINVINWPSVSPDLNPIENLWGIMVRKVYANGQQFTTINELHARVKFIWSEIIINELQNLVTSMPNRLFEVIKRNGGHTNY